MTPTGEGADSTQVLLHILADLFIRKSVLWADWSLPLVTNSTGAYYKHTSTCQCRINSFNQKDE